MEDDRWYRCLVVFTLTILSFLFAAAADAQVLRPPGHPGLSAETSVSPADIPVLENALGDVVRDSVVNLLDFLRLRDILAGRGPAPTSYEQAEADLTVDGSVTRDDLDLLRNILLRKAGVPYVVNEAGGAVHGDGITLTIPPGALDSVTVLSITRQSESEFASTMGVDTKAALADSAYYMTGFTIASGNIDFKIPANATIKLDSIPPCAYRGLNGLFAGTPDRDGDGRGELFFMNELAIDADSLTISTNTIPLPSIQSTSLSSVEPGTFFTINGEDFGNDPLSVVVKFTSATTPDSFQKSLPLSFSDSAITVIVPNVAAGVYKVTAQGEPTGVVSNSQTIDVLPLHSPAANIRTTLVDFYTQLSARLDSINVDSLEAGVEDTIVHSYLTSLHVRNHMSFDSTAAFFTAVPESSLAAYSSKAAFIENITSSQGLAGRQPLSLAGGMEGCWPCDNWKWSWEIYRIGLAPLQMDLAEAVAECMKYKVLKVDCEPCEYAKRLADQLADYTDEYADAMEQWQICACRFCKEQAPRECSKCQTTRFVGFGPRSSKIVGGYKGGIFKIDGYCLNIIKYESNECIHVINAFGGDNPVEDWMYKAIKCGWRMGGRIATIESLVESSSEARAHPGSIVKITNVPILFNIVSIMGENGQAFIPHVPRNTWVTFAIYDPVTGFYDPDAGTYLTGSTPGGFDYPELLFQPNTSIRSILVKLGEVIHDSVSSNYQRTDYVLSIGAADTGKLLNLGFEASTQLSFRLTDPDGDIIVDSGNSSCYFNRLKFGKIGAYRIRVAFGTTVQPGSYVLGVNEPPASPIDRFFVCGKFIGDTLYQIFSPYTIDQDVGVSIGDTVTVESGVTLIFDNGGSVRSDGTFSGHGSPGNPIILQRVPPLQQPTAAIRPVKVPDAAGKEVQP